MKNESEIEEIVKKALATDRVNVERQEYRIVPDTCFYQRNDHIYDSSEYWFEEVIFPEEAIEHEKKTILDENPDVDEHEATCEAMGQLMDDLAYWTIYYKPDIQDVEAALKSGLTPFEYQGDFYLALGGCGMDLSPKLEAYQCLTSGTIPEGSHFLRYPDYFRNVVGNSTADEAFAACTRDTARVIISYDAPRDDYR